MPLLLVWSMQIGLSPVSIAQLTWLYALTSTRKTLADRLADALQEEIARPEKMIPISIMGTVAIGFVTAWTFGISMFFSVVGDFNVLIDSATGVPILELFNQALTGRSARTAGAIVLEALIIATGIGCLIASHTWQSRLCWSFARDRGVPFGGFFSKVERGLDVPLRAHALSCVIVAAVGCLYLGSSTAFNSMVTATITLLYMSYSIPVVCLLIKGRNRIAHGPFCMSTPPARIDRKKSTELTG